MKKKGLVIVGIILGILAILALAGAAVIISLLIIFKNDKDTNNDKDKTEYVMIKFDVAGGEFVEDLKVEKGKTAELPLTIKDGYTFQGWYLDDEKIDDDYKFKKDTTLTAEWEAIKEDTKTFTITFDSKGGSKVKAVTLACDTKVTLPKNPTKTGYTFVSWADKNGKVILNGALLTCDNITLYANWKKKETKTDTKETKTETTIKEDYSKEVIEESGTESCPKDGNSWELDIEKHKCTSKKNPEYYCTDGYKNSTVDNTVCYKYIKAPDSVTCKDGRYHYTQGSLHFCATELPSYTGSKQMCENNGGQLLSNNHCVKNVEQVGNSKLNFVCTNSEFRGGSALASGEKDGCYDLKQREYGCAKAGNGYSMNHTYGKCMKTVDSIITVG